MDEERNPVGKRPLVVVANSGLSMASGVILFGAVGYAIDRRRGGGVVYTVGGILLGLLLGMYELWKLVRRLNHRSE
ncbi:MAG: AtpZ/AtpI family protein [Verrucomicrobia bacterium]|nr:AtpZ/AtpI family protein [Verrucomicrobiota bacterium]MDA1085865.1 AtpZ/AtpI family protein [Verrucomicrobiota bacterium]